MKRRWKLQPQSLPLVRNRPLARQPWLRAASCRKCRATLWVLGDSQTTVEAGLTPTGTVAVSIHRCNT